MSDVTVGQKLYAFHYDDVVEYEVVKATAKTIKAKGPYWTHTLTRFEGVPVGAVAVGSNAVRFWTTSEECALAAVQELRKKADDLTTKADEISARFLGGGA